LKLSRHRPDPALIRINRGAVAEKHQSTENSYCGHYDIASPGFLFYSDSPPFFSIGPGRWSGQDNGVAQWANKEPDSLECIGR
jgi:hypothetical protein